MMQYDASGYQGDSIATVLQCDTSYSKGVDKGGGGGGGGGLRGLKPPLFLRFPSLIINHQFSIHEFCLKFINIIMTGYEIQLICYSVHLKTIYFVLVNMHQLTL